MRIVFMGTPEFSVSPLKSLVLGGFEVVAVYTQPEKPAGRGLRVVPSPVKLAALSLNLPVFEPKTLRGEEAANALTRLEPEAIVVAAYARLLPPSLLNIPRCGGINIHPSLLPRHRGPSPIPAAILAGDASTGVSIMLMDRGLDTGPLLSQAQLPIVASDTTGRLTSKLSALASELIVAVLPRWARGEISPFPQEDAKATYSAPLKRESGELDWKKPADALSREVRAYNPWPGSYTFFHGKRLKILEALSLPLERSLEAGEVVRLDYFSEGVSFGVATGGGILGTRRLQLEGKQAMTSADFLRGQRDLIGTVLPD